MDTRILLSMGGGVQSTSLALMLDKGILSPRPDLAIFADTGAEPQAVYDNVTWLSSEIQTYPIVWTRGFRAKRGFINLESDVINQREQGGLPLGGGPIRNLSIQPVGRPSFLGRRQCTAEYKNSRYYGSGAICVLLRTKEV